MATHTFELFGPDDDLASEEAGSLTSTAPRGRSFKLVTYSGTLGDVEQAYGMRGWISVGSGDQRPTVPAFTQSYGTTNTTIEAIGSWSAPGITASYIGGLILLADAARNTSLNDLATKCANLEAEITALRSQVVTLKGNVNALVDLHQAYGMAT